MKIYKLKKETVKEGAYCDIGIVEVRKSESGYLTAGNRRVPKLDVPMVKVSITVYSEDRSTAKMERFCARIRRAIAEYGGSDG